MGETEALPVVDEHQVLVAAPVDVVWQVLGVIALDSRAGRVGASVLGASPRRAGAGPLTEGGTVPGFAAREAVPGERLVLGGRHRFSDYALTLTLTAQPVGTLLSARTNASFPGPHGRAYRALVISSGAHRVMVRRMLAGVRHAAEARWSWRSTGLRGDGAASRRRCGRGWWGGRSASPGRCRRRGRAAARPGPGSRPPRR
jgi:hypothetical protein